MNWLNVALRPVWVLGLGLAFIVPSLAASRACGAEVLIADQAGNRIIALDEATGDFIRVVTATGLDLPSSLSFGPGGFLYATNFGAYAGPGSAASVVRIDPVTGVTTPFITTIAGPGSVGFDPGDPTSLFVSKLADFVIVEGEPAADFIGNEVYQYDALGNLVNTIGTGSAATGRVGIEFDDEGDLYVSEFKFFGEGSVLKYDRQNSFAPLGTYADGAGMVLQGPPGAFIPSQAGGLNGLAFDADGALYVAALTGTAVVKFTDDGDSVEGEQIDGPLAYPSDVLVESSGTVLVTLLGNNNNSDPYYPGNLFPGTVVRYHPATGALTPLLVGDADRDNRVDGDDLTAWETSFGVDGQSDFDGDGATDGSDFLQWQRGVGNESAAGAFLPTSVVRYEPILVTGAPVPEPGAACLALAAAVGWWSGRSFRQRR